MDNVIRLPTARTEPVQQQPRRGRFPKSIGRIREARYKRLVRQDEIARLDLEWSLALTKMSVSEMKLKQLGVLPTLWRAKFAVY